MPEAPVLELIKLTLTPSLQSSGSPGRLIQEAAAAAAPPAEGTHIERACVCLLVCHRETHARSTADTLIAAIVCSPNYVKCHFVGFPIKRGGAFDVKGNVSGALSITGKCLGGMDVI